MIFHAVFVTVLVLLSILSLLVAPLSREERRPNQSLEPTADRSDV